MSRGAVDGLYLRRLFRAHSRAGQRNFGAARLLAAVLDVFYALATYGFAGHMREQVCKYMCPYARFQSAMFDEDTLDRHLRQRPGEPRGVRSKRSIPRPPGWATASTARCACRSAPPGIDIRNGLQYQCIGCGLCVDACNTVMDKVGYPRGLIRFATQNGMRQRWTNHQMLRRVFRPRVLGYGAVLLTLAVAMMVSLVTRTPLKVDVVRDRTAIARIVPGASWKTCTSCRIMNATETPQHYRISAQGLEGLNAGPGFNRASARHRRALGVGAAANPLRQRSTRLAPDPLHRASPGAPGPGAGKSDLPGAPLARRSF